MLFLKILQTSLSYFLILSLLVLTTASIVFLTILLLAVPGLSLRQLVLRVSVTSARCLLRPWNRWCLVLVLLVVSAIFRSLPLRMILFLTQLLLPY